jgi:hypothetical protein
MKKIPIVMLFTLCAMAADISGTWTGTFKVASGDRREPQLLILKQNGNNLTGSGGPDTIEQYPIQNGTVDGDVVTFELSSDSWKFGYHLKRVGQTMSGDLKLKSTKGDTRSATVTLRKVD